MTLVLACIAALVIANVFAWCLCRAAANGDRNGA